MIAQYRTLGDGTLNYLLKWTPNGLVAGNSQVFDNGSVVCVGSTSVIAGSMLTIDATGKTYGIFLNSVPDGNYSQYIVSSTREMAMYSTTAGGFFGTVSNHSFALLANASAKMTVAASGAISMNSTTVVGSILNVVGSASLARDGGINGAIEIQASAAAASPGLIFSNISSARTPYIQWTTSTSGNAGAFVMGYMYLTTTGTNSTFSLDLNNNVGTTGVTNALTILSGGQVGLGATTSPTAILHLPAGTTTASTAPLKFTTGTSLTSAEAGAMEYTTDDLFFTISAGTARKRLLMADPVGGLTSGRVAFATTNGRLTDDSDMTFLTDTLTVTKIAHGQLTMTEATNMVFGTTTGSQIGAATNQKIAFHGSTPVIQRVGAAQAAVVTTASALASYGYTQAQADSIVTLVNELRAAMVEKGLIKGSA